ncbi:MAG: hypothetical protein JXR73_03955 [Candidatus Omnitrophica bacterium]|nr:hypothetical protein [Candidatus Omnitrophota bacterium]
MNKPKLTQDSTRDGHSTDYLDWEAELEKIEVKQDHREVSLDPIIMDQIFAQDDGFEFAGAFAEADAQEEIQSQIDLIIRIARKKLSGLTRYCILLILMSGASLQRIAQILGASQDVVKRAVNRGVKIIRECLSLNYGEFPVSPGKRPPLRASLFPLDTSDERQKFQTFLNQHTVAHISYRGEDPFREALVVYFTGKAAKKR